MIMFEELKALVGLGATMLSYRFDWGLGRGLDVFSGIGSNERE